MVTKAKVWFDLDSTIIGTLRIWELLEFPRTERSISQQC